MDKIIPVYSSPDRIEQVLVILVDNAIKHTPEDGTVTLSAMQMKDTIEIRVADTGEGIPSEDTSHIFERFYEVDKSHSGGGTGLRLSIAHEIMSGLGESIGVKSRAEGTCFIFTVHKN